MQIRRCPCLAVCCDSGTTAGQCRFTQFSKDRRASSNWRETSSRTRTRFTWCVSACSCPILDTGFLYRRLSQLWRILHLKCTLSNLKEKEPTVLVSGRSKCRRGTRKKTTARSEHRRPPSDFPEGAEAAIPETASQTPRPQMTVS